MESTSLRVVALAFNEKRPAVHCLSQGDFPKLLPTTKQGPERSRTLMEERD